MEQLWPFYLTSLIGIGGGLWYLCAPLDDLWARQERYLLARGQSPSRNAVWESSVRRSGVVLLTLGLVFLLLPALIHASVPPKMSGVSINGHALTQEQWDACHHDGATCLTMYANGQLR